MSTQRSIENLENETVVWNLHAVTSGALRVTVPSRLILPPLGHATMTIVLDASGVANDSLGLAAVYFVESGGTRVLRLPVAVLRKQNNTPLSTRCAPTSIRLGESIDCTIDVANTDVTPAAMIVFDSLPAALQLVPDSVTGAVRSGNAVVQQTTLAPAVSGGIDVRLLSPVRRVLGLEHLLRADQLLRLV